MAEQIELMMRQVKLGGMAKGWRSVQYENTEQYVTELLKLELQEREANRINRMVKTAGFRVLKTLDEFVWNSAIELPSGLTQEYMTDLHFLTPKENLIFIKPRAEQSLLCFTIRECAGTTKSSQRKTLISSAEQTKTDVIPD